MSRREDTPLRALRCGLIAGAGTAAMTAAQTAYYKSTGSEPSTTPAEVAKRVIRGVLHRDVSDDVTGPLNNAMHWAYGTSWGILYSLASRRPTLVAFAGVVWGASLIELPAMKLAPPVWKMPPESIAPDAAFHLLYGTAAALTHRALS